MSAHVPTFHNVTEWEQGRTSTCWAVCPCGWESELCQDQTHAEAVHGRHLVQVGVLSADEVTP